MTNYDRIKSMSVEEMSAFIVKSKKIFVADAYKGISETLNKHKKFKGYSIEIDNSKVGTICTNSGDRQAGVFWVQNSDMRVRKLTPRECFRLMGVKDEDYERLAENQSKSSLYHLAGDSIITSVLMALFGEMLGIDWRSKVDDLAEDLSKERNIENDTY